MTSRLEQLFARRTVLCDGAMGTSLYGRGVFINRCFDELNLSQPELVRSVHEEYLQAGAEIIETNTFGANALRLAALRPARQGRRDQSGRRQNRPPGGSSTRRQAGRHGLGRGFRRASRRASGAARQDRPRRGAGCFRRTDSCAGLRRSRRRRRPADYRNHARAE